MFISKSQLKAIQFASPDETRQALNGLYITESEVVATDGHRLMLVEHGEMPEELDAFPTMPESEPPPIPGTLSAASIESALKASKIKKRVQYPCHDWVWVSKDFISVLDANFKVINFPAEWVDGKFPDYKQVIPKDSERPFHIGLNARYLADGAYLADEKSKMLDIGLLDRNHGALIKGQNEVDQKCKYIIMPMLVDASEADREKEEAASKYTGLFLMKDIDPSAIHNHITPLETTDIIEINGQNYLKADLDAFLQSKQEAVAV